MSVRNTDLFARTAVEAIALISKSDRTYLLYNPIKDIADETLLRELQGRGYNVTSRRENNTAEIVKIG